MTNTPTELTPEINLGKETPYDELQARLETYVPEKLTYSDDDLSLRVSETLLAGSLLPGEGIGIGRGGASTIGEFHIKKNDTVPADGYGEEEYLFISGSHGALVNNGNKSFAYMSNGRHGSVVDGTPMEKGTMVDLEPGIHEISLTGDKGFIVDIPATADFQQLREAWVPKETADTE